MTDVRKKLIPKSLHAVWLGEIPSEKEKNNILNWKEINPDYEVNVWVDSSLYSSSKENKKKFKKFIKWCKDKEINIRDVDKEEKFLEKMPASRFYNDEINGSDKNFAAASDLLRAEILYQFGGVYFDINDMKAASPLGDLYAELGFLCNWRDGILNNDLLASLPGDVVITLYRERMLKQYEKLYKNNAHINTHRNTSYSTPERYGWKDGRLESTIHTSGAGTLLATLNLAQLKETFKNNYNQHFFQFPKQHYQPSVKTDKSWFDETVNEKKVIEILRNALRLGINNYLTQLRGDESLKPFLVVIQQQVNSISLSSSLVNLAEQCKQRCKNIQPYNEKLTEIFTWIQKTSTVLEEKFIPYLLKYYNPATIFNNLERLIYLEKEGRLNRSVTPNEMQYLKKEMFQFFITTCLIEENGEPDINTLIQKFNFVPPDRKHFGNSI